MKNPRIFFTLSFTFYLVSAATTFLSGQPALADGISAETVMEKNISLYDGTTRVLKQKISTCQYTIVDKRLSCSESPRIKVAESFIKDYGANEEDSKSLTLIVEPAAEQGVGLLQFDYGDADRDPDQWIYLSALGKPKRVASGKADEDEPKKGSLFGSEFSLEDIEKMRLSDYQYEMLEEVEYNGRPCWVIKLVPTKKRAAKSNYSKQVMWIDKERFYALKTQYYDRKGMYVKRKTQTDWKLVDDVWISKKIVMDNLSAKRVSILIHEDTAINVEIDDEFLTLRSLTDRAFRERNLKQLKISYSMR